MRSSVICSFSVVTMFVCAVLLGGCGSGNKEGQTFPTAQATVIDNANCTNACHAASKDLSGVLVDEWNASVHKKVGVECQGCHGPGSLHWGLGPIPFPNPDAALICSNCHSRNALGAPHYNSISSAAYPAQYVSSQNVGKCTRCHEPHDNTLLPQNTDWAGSAHAAFTDRPFTEDDFKTLNTCNRCHTTTGFVNFLQSGNLNQPAWGSPSDNTKELIDCNACHVDYSWQRRDGITSLNPVGVKFPYPVTFGNTTTNILYVLPPVGESNLCCSCHSFRKSGRSAILTKVTNGTSFSSVRQHYLGAAGTLYRLAGYEFLPHTPNYDNFPFFSHADIGILATASNGDDISSLQFSDGSLRGPCVGCHLWGDPPSHTLDPAVISPPGSINGTVTAIPANPLVCSLCHAGKFAMTPASLTAEKQLYRDRLAALAGTLQTKLGIFYNPDIDPYFFTDSTSLVPFTLWQTAATTLGGGATANQVIGAAFNLQLCFKEPGGYVHNDKYTGDLIYDSLDLLDNGRVDGSYVNSVIFPAGRP
ncbi:MAG TPA: hypothetical protein VMJ66_17825 [Geobacteraceae bacterium]|nr:hypothetical protein [Geobacteraceae bacterium]